jgi:hypothetical protein
MHDVDRNPEPSYPQVAEMAVEMWKKEKFAKSDKFSLFGASKALNLTGDDLIVLLASSTGRE